MREIKKIEDIYPLTIVKRRFGGIAIVNTYSINTCVDELQENEEWHYGDSAQKNMESDYSGIHYGLGNTLNEAFNDYLSRIDDIDRKHKEYLDSIPPLSEEDKERLVEITKPLMGKYIGLPHVELLASLNEPIGIIVYMDYKYSGTTTQNK